MRSLSILMLGLAFVGGLAAPPLAVAHAAEAGVSCENHPNLGWIFCTVKQPTYSVKSVTLNHGTCPSPVPTAEDVQLARHFDRLLATGDRSLTNTMPAMMNIPGYFSALCVKPNSGEFPDHSRKECPSFLASQKIRYTPIGTYKAGDQFRVATFGCDEVMEVTIDSDDGADTFQFADK
jgi:hypothetical protein